MKREVGIWIDPSKAVIVTIINEKQQIQEIKSNFEKKNLVSNNKTSKTKSKSPESIVEDGRDRQTYNAPDRYYEAVISFIRDAQTILIFGPGEAKTELEECLKREKLGERIVGVVSANKMTDPQIAAKVRNHFYKY